MNEALREAYARADATVLHLDTLELRHPQFQDGVIRLDSYDVDIGIGLEANAPLNGGETVQFFANGMDVSMPSISTDPDGEVIAQIDGVSGFLQPYFGNANKTQIPIEATVRPIGYDVTKKTALDVLEIRHLQVRHVQIRLATIVLTMGYTNSANIEFPAINYTADSHPGLY